MKRLKNWFIHLIIKKFGFVITEHVLNRETARDIAISSNPSNRCDKREKASNRAINYAEAIMNLKRTQASKLVKLSEMSDLKEELFNT